MELAEAYMLIWELNNLLGELFPYVDNWKYRQKLINAITMFELINDSISRGEKYGDQGGIESNE